MPSTHELKSRIRSVKNTGKITGAMQLVAASKMRRATEATKASTPYTLAAEELLTYLASQGTTTRHPAFVTRPVKSRLLIVVASDKGLAGAYNTNILRAYTRELIADDAANINNETIAVGRRATQFVTRLKDTTVVGVYDDIPDHPRGDQLYAILNTVEERFTTGDVDAVDVIYTEFHSSLRQEVRVRRVLPAGFTPVPVSPEIREAEYEPDIDAVLDAIAYRLVGAQIFQALLDARASEHSMRMVAMKNATDNAHDLSDDLTLEMNKARQSAITQELAEISGGVEALTE
jgi:F-type H+-transporting ATPase subunit gamma